MLPFTAVKEVPPSLTCSPFGSCDPSGLEVEEAGAMLRESQERKVCTVTVGARCAIDKVDGSSEVRAVKKTLTKDLSGQSIYDALNT